MKPYTLPPVTVQDYVRHGAVVMRGVLTPDEVATLARGIEHNLAHLSPLVLVASQADDPGKFVEDFCTWQDNGDYANVMQQSALPRVAAQLMQSDTVRIYHDHLLVKEAGTRQPTPWHQDQPYCNVAGRQNVSFWIRWTLCHCSARCALWLARILVLGTCRAWAWRWACLTRCSSPA